MAAMIRTEGLWQRDECSIRCLRQLFPDAAMLKDILD
jgi:hypothetical protein